MSEQVAVGQIWRNRQSRKAWTVRRFETPPRREWPVIGRSIVVLGADDTRNEPSARVPWLIERYDLITGGGL